MAIKPRYKHIVLFIRKKGDVPEVFNRKKVVPSVSRVRFKYKNDKRVWPLDIEQPAFKIGKKYYYLVDIESGQMSFKSTKQIISPQFLESILIKETARQLASGLEKIPFLENLFMYILCIGLGLALGFILGNVVIQ